MGELVGGIIGVFILYSIWEWALFQRIFDDPMKGKLTSVVAAYLTASILYGFGAANGGPFVLDGFIIYLLGAMVISVYAWRRASKLREQASEAEAFD